MSRSHRRGRTRAAAVALLGVVALVAYVTLRPRTISRGGPEPRLTCRSHLVQIGQAILLYSFDHAGATPASVDALRQLRDDDVPWLEPVVFRCPSRDRDGTSTGDDYVYCGDRLPMPFADAPADAVIAIDREMNHDADGANVLFAGGRVEFMPTFVRRGEPTPAWASARAQFAAGVRPVIWRAGATTTEAR